MSTLQPILELARVVLQVDGIPGREDSATHLVSTDDMGTSIEQTATGWRIAIDEAGSALLSAEGATLDEAESALRAQVEAIADAVQREIAARVAALAAGGWAVSAPLTLAPCSCGCAFAHVVADRETADSAHLRLWSDGALTGRGGYAFPGVPIAHGRAAEADHVALAARVTAAEAAHAALAVARKAMIDAGERYRAAWDAVTAMPPTAAQSEEIAAALRVSYEAQDALSVALDALLRGAPGGYVRASVVQRYMHAAENSVDAGEMIEARGALVDALAAAGSACRSDDDGDCRWNRCPQRLDGEPWVTGRVCPLTKET